MVIITASTLIDRAPDEVFNFVGNYENDPLWRDGVFEMQHEPSGHAQVGTKTREVMRFLGRDAVTYAEVVEYDMGHKTAFKTTSGAFSAQGYRLVEPEQEQTHFTYYAQAEVHGLLRLLDLALFRWTISLSKLLVSHTAQG